MRVTHHHVKMVIMKQKEVRKAVIAAAGMGTRFLPQTKAMPKEMLPIMGKPIIQWVVEELVGAGVTDIIIVTGYAKRALEDHFDRSIELEEALRSKGKDVIADEIKSIAEMANFVYIRQKAYKEHKYGTGVPLMNSAHLIGDEPFFFVSADDLFVNPNKSRARQMLDAYKETGKSIVSLLPFDKKDSEKYGVASITKEIGNGVVDLDGFIEKPKPEDAPSEYMGLLWYLLNSDVFDYAKDLGAGKGGELQAADAVNGMAKEGKVSGKVLEGTYHDCGTYVNYLKASLHFASQYDQVHADISTYVKDKILRD
jgi:UTP--glucose-1-phosphate uridylyltransferase